MTTKEPPGFTLIGSSFPTCTNKQAEAGERALQKVMGLVFQDDTPVAAIPWTVGPGDAVLPKGTAASVLSEPPEELTLAGGETVEASGGAARRTSSSEEAGGAARADS